MEKEVFDEFCREESTEWSFPDLELFIKADYDASSIDNDCSLKSGIDQNSVLANSIRENENLKNSYQHKIALLDTLISKLENPVKQLDKDLIEIMEHVIKLAVKKIIYKEIESDATLISKIVEELAALLDSNNGMFTVMLCESDYAQLVNDYDKSTMILKMSPALNKGDVIVKSNLTEIHAILNERINQVLGKQNV